MAQGRFIAYFRVSTQRQGRSGLGLEAQREAVMSYLNGGQWTLLDTFTEVESGKNNERPELAKALEACELSDATLVVAKLDRLSRDAVFLLRLQKSDVRIVFANMPQADGLTIGVLAILAQWEREQISKRTKEALARSTKKLGKPAGTIIPRAAEGRAVSVAHRVAKADDRAAKVMKRIDRARAEGHTSLRDIAGYLNRSGVRTTKGADWSAVQVSRVIARSELQQL